MIKKYTIPPNFPYKHGDRVYYLSDRDRVFYVCGIRPELKQLEGFVFIQDTEGEQYLLPIAKIAKA